MNSIFKEKDDSLLDVVKSHLVNGQDPNAGSQHGETPLRQSFRKGRMDVVALLVKHGADINQLNWSPLHQAIALGSSKDVRSFLQNADTLVRDRTGLTPFLLACDVGDVEKAAMLLTITPSEGLYTDYHHEPAIIVATQKRRIDAVKWLLSTGFMVDEPAEFGLTALIAASAYNFADIVAVLLEAGANINAMDNVSASLRARNPEKYEDTGHETINTAISCAVSAKVARQLMSAGASINDFGPRVTNELIGAQLIPEQTITSKIFHDQKHRRFGISNPEEATCEYWLEAIRGKVGGWFGRKEFGLDETSLPAIWSFDRFGKSTTELPDGRWVQIGGEHEDWYDPDFCIYSDVFVFDGKGEVQIFIYPKNIFPPTDHHTATLVHNNIIIIGNLGYVDDRMEGITQVLQLDLSDFSIKRLQTVGETPGWISDHRAELVDGKIRVTNGEIFIGDEFEDNLNEFELDILSGVWSKSGSA